MKKLLCLFLALVLCLSLCACGSDKAMTKEEMLECAKDFDFSKFTASAKENKINAEETYVGNIYKISGFVHTIDNSSCTLRTLSSYGDLTGYIYVPLSRDELKTLKVNERISVVGEIDKVTSSDTVKLGSSYYVGNTFEATVDISSIVYASASDKLPKYTTAFYKGFVDACVAPLCNIYLEGEDLAKLNKDDTITVSGRMVIYEHNEQHIHHGSKVIFKIEDAELIN